MAKKRYIFTIGLEAEGETAEEAYNNAQVKLKDMGYMDEVMDIQCEPLYEEPVKIPGEKLSDLTTEEIYRKLGGKAPNTCDMDDRRKWICARCKACACGDCFEGGKCRFCGHKVRILN